MGRGRGAGRPSYQNEEWQKFISKKEARRDRKFRNREERLKNTTSFFVSNLSDGCTTEKLWAAFEHFDNLEDSFVPFKRDGVGNKFGFLRFSGIDCSDEWIEKLKMVSIGGAILGVKLAKFNRDGSKVSQMINRGNGSVFNRVYVPNTRRQEKKVEPPINVQPQTMNRSYSNVVAGGSAEFLSKNNIILPPLNTEARKNWIFKSLIGEVRELEFLDRMEDFVDELELDGVALKYLGGLKVLIIFQSSKEASGFLDNYRERWAAWLTKLEVWDGCFKKLERIAWIRATGVPISLWDRHVFNRIGERCRKLVIKSDVATLDSDLSSAKMAVLVDSGEKINSIFKISCGVKQCRSGLMNMIICGPLLCRIPGR
ncbi:putative RNA recognition motif domain, nucleotide-binding alpha-beta plait domain superfamily [Helianthus annuus]|nr:putative RNA recognition motif domain, nucleotide-binding alpha-beta plait domain superfamily [Helianthus annuus]